MAAQYIVTDNSWQRVPDDFSLIDPESWKTSVRQRFGAVRKIYLIVKKRSVDTIDGPILLRRTLPEDTEIKNERKISVVTKRIDTISTSVQKTITSKLSSELSTKLNAELGLFPVPGSAKVSGEIQSKIAAEFTTALSNQLATTRSFEVTNLEELTSSVTLKLPSKEKPPRKYYFFLPVHTCHWDIYLYQQETLEFTYKTKLWYWNKRENEKHSLEDLKVPLARLVFYEPEDDPFPSLQMDPFTPAVVDGSKVTVEELKEPCPTVEPDDENSLQDLAITAVPVTKEEQEIKRAVRAQAPTQRSRKDRIIDNLSRAGAKGGAARRASKKGAAKRAMKSAARTAYKRPAKISRKAAARRSGKRSSRRR